MAKESSLIANLMEWATFKDPAWATFIRCEIEDLEKTKDKYLEECKKADKLKAEVEQLEAYVDVLEKQLSLTSKILEKTRNVKFPIYTVRRRCKNATQLHRRTRRTHENGY